MTGRLLKTLFVVQFLLIAGYPRDGTAKTVEAEAELVRLQSDIVRLMQRNAWKGVERAYLAMLDLDTDLRAQDHMAGEQAARLRGDISSAYVRLSAAIGDRDSVSANSKPDIKDALLRLQSIEQRYGRVSLEVQSGRIPALVRFDWPFPREERVAIEVGRVTLAKERVYKGFLPIGKYMIDGQFFEIDPGNTSTDILVKSPENP